MASSILRGVIGYRAYLRASRVPLLDLNAPRTVVVIVEVDPETGAQSAHVERRFVLPAQRTPWPDSDAGGQGVR